MDRIKILAIVVTYNRKELLLENIKALLNQKFAKNDIELSILIVDNNSTDGTKNEINYFIENKKINYTNTGKNIGGAGGFNFGIKKAFKEFDFSYVWLMDDDTIPAENSLDRLIEANKILGKDVGFLASKVLWTDNSICKMNIPKITDNWWEKSEYIQHGYIKLESTSFVSCLVSKNAIIKVGLPIKEFFIWGDDVEFTKRISDVYDSYFINDSIVIHKMKSNIPTNMLLDNDINRIKRQFYMYRNRFYIRKKEGLKGIIKHTYMFLSNYYKAIFKTNNHRLLRANSILKGYICGIFFNPQIEYIVENKK